MMDPANYNLAYYQYNSSQYDRTYDGKQNRDNNLRHNGVSQGEGNGNNGRSNDVLRMAVDSVLSKNMLESSQSGVYKPPSFEVGPNSPSSPVYLSSSKSTPADLRSPITPRTAKAEKRMYQYWQAQEKFLLAPDKVKPTNKSKPKKKKHPVLKEATKAAMSKAMTKRFNHFLKEGFSEQQAYDKAYSRDSPKKRPSNRQQATKRTLFYDSAGQVANKKKKQLNKGPPNGPQTSQKQPVPAKKKPPPQSNDEFIKPIEISVAPDAFPLKELTIAESENLKTAVEMLLGEQKVGEVKPHFTQRPIFKRGTIVFHCLNRSTADWLQSLPIWAHQECMTWEEPEKFIHLGHFASSVKMSAYQVLSMIQGQNDNISTQNWRVLSRSEKHTTLVLLLEVDRESHERLKALKFNVNFGFGQQVKLTPKRTWVHVEPNQTVL